MNPAHDHGHGRRRLLRALLAAPAATALRAQAQAQATPPLLLALAPFLSPAALLAAFEPLRAHLQRRLRRPVETLTARDFRSLMASTQRIEHDVVQLPAHLARLTMLDWGWHFLAAPLEPSTAIVAVRDGGPVRTPSDLRGQTVAMLDPLSLTATVGRRWLELQGLADSVTVQAQPSINSMLFALDRGEVAAFVAATTQLLSLPAATPRGERVLARIEGIPAPLYMARPTLPPGERRPLRAAMASFEPDASRPGTAANSRLGALPAARLAALDAYAAIARRTLAEPPR